MQQSQRPIESATHLQEVAIDMSVRAFPPLPSSPPDQNTGLLPGVSHNRQVNGNNDGVNMTDSVKHDRSTQPHDRSRDNTTVGQYHNTQ